jgi:hypothetical protein
MYKLSSKEGELMEAVKDQQSQAAQLIAWLESIIFIAGLIFIALLPFHLVIKKIVPDPLGTYWKEILLGLMVLAWAGISLLRREMRFSGNRSLDLAVLLYLGLIGLRFVLDRSGLVGWWGLYISVMYLPLFWLIPALLRSRPAWLERILFLLVAVGAIVSLGGILEFILNTTLWPSAEIIERQGFPDFYVFGTQLRRVYFVFDSPTTLANTLAMLLPLALALFVLKEQTWQRVFSALAAVLMVVGIIFTFSRGIWVAAALAFLVMGALWFLKLRAGAAPLPIRPVLLVGLIVVFIAIVAVGALAVSRSSSYATTGEGAVELSSQDYRLAPVTAGAGSLIEIQRAAGAIAYQNWVLLDPITRQDDAREVLLTIPRETGQSEVIYSLTVPENGAIQFGIALDPEVWSPDRGDGVAFQLYVARAGSDQAGQLIFDRFINPKINPNDRLWRNFLVDLSPWAGEEIQLSLIAQAGPAGDYGFDWAGWSDLAIVTMQPGYFDQNAQRQNPAIRHFGSILDWARDQTNRDRLAAWSNGLSAWLASPLWGQGLGTTGAAALRSEPERAFVTESQVLKSLTELGILGLAVLAYLWYQIGRTGISNLIKASDRYQQFLLLGICTSLLIIFIEGFVYQNLEVKQVNAYFWVLTGILAYLSGQQDG